MDLKEYYGKIRETAEGLPGDFVVIVSLKTPDGGKEGVRTEVDRQQAARMIVDGRARAATTEEAAQFHTGQRDAIKKAQEDEQRKRVHVTIIPDEDLAALRKGSSKK